MKAKINENMGALGLDDQVDFSAFNKWDGLMMGWTAVDMKNTSDVSFAHSP